MRRRIWILAILGITVPVIAWGQQTGASLAGTWTGVWVRAADTLDVTMRFEQVDGVWRGEFDAERLRVVGIPFQAVEFEPPSVSVHLVGDATTTVFSGRVEEDSLTGALHEGEDSGRFALGRDSRAAPALRQEDIRFRNVDVELAGTLILPSGSGPHPAVVFVHGSGGEGRWASRYLARRFVRAGFAALIWDKRGVGESSGKWTEAGFEDLAADVAAAIAFMRSRPEVDPVRVGIHGHSQGGTIAPLAAVRSGADFVIASAASGLPMAEVEIYSVGNSIGLRTLPRQEAAIARAYVEALVDVAYRERRARGWRPRRSAPAVTPGSSSPPTPTTPTGSSLGASPTTTRSSGGGRSRSRSSSSTDRPMSGSRWSRAARRSWARSIRPGGRGWKPECSKAATTRSGCAARAMSGRARSRGTRRRSSTGSGRTKAGSAILVCKVSATKTCARRFTLVPSSNSGGPMGLFDRKKDKKKADFSNVESGSSATAPQAEEARVETYTVRSGDTLWAISKRFYGDGNQWGRIYEANRDTIKDPDLIQPGWELNIPRPADVEGEVE